MTRLLRTWRRWLPGVIIGLGVAFVSCLLFLADLPALSPILLNTGDTVFIKEGGPRLGARAVDPGIVLVLWDTKSRREISVGGSVRSTFEQDLALYRTLLADDPIVVADTVSVFESDPLAKELLEGMAASGGGSKLLRAVYALPEPNGWYVAGAERYQRHVAHHAVFSGAALDPSQYVRFYPFLSYLDYDGGTYFESMALQVARAMLNGQGDSFLRSAVQSGLMERWYRATGFSVPAELRTPEPPRPYELAPGHSVPWLWRFDSKDAFGFSPAVLWINYTGPPGQFATVSYVDVLQRRVPASFFRGKAVLVGDAEVTPSRVPTTASQQTNNAEIVAQAVQTVLDGHFMEPMSIPQAVGGVAAVSLICALAVTLLRPVQSLIVVPGILALYAAYAIALYRLGTYPDLVAAPSALLASALLGGAYSFGREELARRHIYDMFGRYVPRSVVSELVRRPPREARTIGGATREITVLFADIRGFTAFSEQMSADDVVIRLNALLEVMVGAAFRYEGTVDKFIGDAIMVIFNAPLSQPDHVLRAVRTALDMQRASATLEGGLAFGVGIHTGAAVVGTVGTQERMEYTAIGSTVNLASRLCDTAGKGQVVVSDEVFACLEARLEAEKRPPIRVKNVDRDLVTYLVTGLSEAPEAPTS